MSSMPTTSLSLMAKLLASPVDQAAWEQWVRRYVDAIYGWCRRWGLQDADARNLTQEVLTRVFLHLHTYDRTKARFRVWLRTVTRNQWNDLIKQQAKEPPGSGDSQILELLHKEPALEDLVKLLEVEFDLDQAFAAVQKRVEPATWDAFRLKVMQGLTADEVARRTGKTMDMVYIAVSRVRKLLEEELHRSDDEGPEMTEDAP